MTPEIQTIKLSQIIFDPEVYPRKSHDPALVQHYAEVMDSIEAELEFISISRNFKLLDGRHRQLAYQTIYKNGNSDREIKVKVYPVEKDDEILDLAASLNTMGRWGLTNDDMSFTARKMYTRANRKPQAEIAKALHTKTEKVNGWLKTIIENEKKEREEKIWSLWMACYEAPEIAGVTGLADRTVRDFLQKMTENFQGKDDAIFRNFEPKVYTVWNFQKLTNKSKVFGSIPQEIIDNLLYYYTKPFDVIFDPFGGGGSTIDVCLERKRRYYVSDLTPIPARSDIRQWDITQGLPDDLPVPDFVFLDPPYWKQAEKKYSDKGTDLGNVSLDTFLETIGGIAKAIKRKWNDSRPDARLAIITGPFYRDGEYVDLPLLCWQTIGKYLDLVERIQVPYSTEIVGGDEVNKAKADKRMLHLLRDLMIFKKGTSNGIPQPGLDT